MRRMIHGLIRHVEGRPPLFWYLTPMALEWSDDVPTSAVIYDCMDELTAFPAAGIDRERLPRVAVAMGETRASVSAGARPSNVGVAALRPQD